MPNRESHDKLSPVVALLKPEIEELIENKDWKTLKDIIVRWHASDIADLFRSIELKDCPLVLRLLPPHLQSEVFAELDSDLQEAVLKSLTNEHIKSIIINLDPDDRTDLLEDMPSELTRRLINLLPPDERKEALWLLGYPQSSVGRLMTPDYVALRPNDTVAQAMERIRRFGKDAETINIVYVVDEDWRLLDDLPIRRLILAQAEESIESLMDFHAISITADQDQEEAIQLCQKYRLIALPVTDAEGHLLGIVTVDDILDVLREEQTEDFMEFSAIETDPAGLDFITRIKEIPITKIVRARITWLLALLIMDLVTGGIIQSFEGMIAKYVVLITFLPVLVDTAGNAGSQSATLVIRALALGTVALRDWAYLMLRELAVGAILGLAMGIGISVMGIVRGRSLTIAGVVVSAMFINVIVGCLIGVLLPFVFTKLRKDPATASTPLITTLADIIGTAIYLLTAYMILH